MISIFIPIAIVAILIMLNGLFVAAEFALLGAPRASVERKAKLGDRFALRLRDILTNSQKQNRYIATAQLGITISSLGLGMYGEHLFADWLRSRVEFIPLPAWFSAHSISSMISIVTLTYLHIVFGEMIPKSLAMQRSEQTANWIVLPMRVFQFCFFPFVIILDGIGTGALWFFGVRRHQRVSDLYHTPKELEFVIKESEVGGLIRKETSEVLQDLLEFGDLKARDVMIPRVKIIGIPLGATVAEVAKIIAKANHTRYIVFDSSFDNVLGSIHMKALLRLKDAGNDVQKDDVRPIPFVPEAATLDQVLQSMRSSASQIVVVLDEYGGTAGIITIEDLFEEIVGDIDEKEESKKAIRRTKDGALLVDGFVRLDEVSEFVNIDFSHDDVNTISGLILTLLGRPAVKGDVVTFRGCSLKVTVVDGHGVGRCKISELAPPSGADES